MRWRYAMADFIQYNYFNIVIDWVSCFIKNVHDSFYILFLTAQLRRGGLCDWKFS